MRLAILTSLMLTVLAAATGCSASGQARQPATPTTSSAAESCDDPSFTPPDQMNLAIGDRKESATTGTKSDLTSAGLVPNKRQIVNGQLHAAY